MTFLKDFLSLFCVYDKSYPIRCSLEPDAFKTLRAHEFLYLSDPDEESDRMRVKDWTIN